MENSDTFALGFPTFHISWVFKKVQFLYEYSEKFFAKIIAEIDFFLKNIKYKMTRLFKILTRTEILDFTKYGFFKGTSKDIKCGYIHLCGNEEQVEYVIKKYYSEYNEVSIVHLHASKFDKIKYRNDFPRYYGNLDFSQINFIATISTNKI